MIRTSTFVHGVDVLDVNLRNNHVEIIARVDGRNITEFAIFGEPFAFDNPPTLKLQGVDVPALLDAASAALRALNKRGTDTPLAAVIEAHALLLSVLKARQ
jgi:hypothetical protein